MDFQVTVNANANIRTYKVQYTPKAEIRRFSLPYPTQFASLKNYVEQLFFAGQPTQFVLKYEDNEKDLVTIANDYDLQLAWDIIEAATLRLFVEHQIQAALPPQFAPTPRGVESSPPPYFPNAPRSEPYYQNAYVPQQPAPLAPYSHPAGPQQGAISGVVQGAFAAVQDYRGHRFDRKADRMERKADKFERKAQSKCEKGRVRGEWRMERKAAKKQWKAEKFSRKAECKYAQADAKRCSENLKGRLVEDVTCPKKFRITPNTPFVKTWRVKNDGSESWPEQISLCFVGRKCAIPMGAPEIIPLAGRLRPGEMMDISINLVSPPNNGFHRGIWLLMDSKRNKIGRALKVKIRVGTSDCCSSDSSSSSDGEYSSMLTQLEEMGFRDEKANRKALKRNKGNFASTVDVLSRETRR